MAPMLGLEVPKEPSNQARGPHKKAIGRDYCPCLTLKPLLFMRSDTATQPSAVPT